MTHDIAKIITQPSIYNCLLYSYFIPVCSIVKTITQRCREQPDALLHEAECNSANSTHTLCF